MAGARFESRSTWLQGQCSLHYITPHQPSNKPGLPPLPQRQIRLPLLEIFQGRCFSTLLILAQDLTALSPFISVISKVRRQRNIWGKAGLKCFPRNSYARYRTVGHRKHSIWVVQNFSILVLLTLQSRLLFIGALGGAVLYTVGFLGFSAAPLASTNHMHSPGGAIKLSPNISK